jgi:hypothetical protein
MWTAFCARPLPPRLSRRALLGAKLLLQSLQRRARFLEIMSRRFSIAQSLARIPSRSLVQSARFLEIFLGLPKRFLEPLDDMLGRFASSLRRLKRALSLRERCLQWTHFHNRRGSARKMAITKRCGDKSVTFVTSSRLQKRA